MDVLRLAGAPGVGKSTAAWMVAQRFARQGVATGYVDMDQLGMCYPPPDDDPERWVLKETALDCVTDEFRRAGVARLVVSGVASPDVPPRALRGTRTRSIWLDASERTRGERLRVRGLGEAQFTSILAAGSAEAGRLHPAWERLDTGSQTEAGTVAGLIRRWRHGSGPAEPVDPPPARRSPDAPAERVLWITGPRLAGASRIGWEVVNSEWRAGRRAGFVDLAQLSFAWNIGASIGVANLTRLHEAFGQAGAGALVVVAPLELPPSAVRSALPSSTVSFVRLVTPHSRLQQHARFRQRGDGPRLAGDDILGLPDAAIDRVVRFSVRQASRPLREHELHVDTADLSLADAAAAVRCAAGWAPR